MLFRRRPHDPAHAAARDSFDAVAHALDRAQRTLLQAIPTSRHPGASLTDALAGFETGIDEVERLMAAWRTPATERWWETCNASLQQAREEARRLHDSPPGPTQFELLNARVADVLTPLEDFAEAERALKKFR